MRTARTRIHWIAAGEGGREQPPPGPRYSAVARFEDATARWPDEAWSIVADILGTPDESLCVMADVRFLVPENSPAELLRIGGRFDLLEGQRVVGRAEITKIIEDES